MARKQAKILTVGNQKGGVGKTFISKHLAEYASIIRGMRVLLVDLDPQTNLSRRYLDMSPSEHDANEYAPPIHPDYYDGDEDLIEVGGRSDASHIWKYGFALPYGAEYQDVNGEKAEYPNLDIMPGHSANLQDIEYVKREDVYDQVVHWLRKFLLLDAIQEEYDLIILDTRPSRGPLVQAAANASTHMLLPTEMESPSIDGIRGMLTVRTNANNQRTDGDELKLLGILVNKYKRQTRLHRSVHEMLESDPDLGPLMLPQILGDWVGYKELMLPKSMSIFLRSDYPKEREQMEAVCGMMIDRMQEA
ncbi:ParA family protein [Thioalkalivibrio sp. ALE19]|uniref:ParA family protein n=1 Tax=Thioalkalivibrio sp. ALE19 TaxID=1266909 RepID=UPI00048DD03E|nr:ParA family protein [Thioalkalivibrio sp. ALE19]